MSIQRLVISSVLLAVVLTAAQLGAADSEVSGIFKGNDQPAHLVFVSAHKGTPVGGKETIKLVFTEKDHSNDERPELKAQENSLGCRETKRFSDAVNFWTNHCIANEIVSFVLSG